MRLIIVGQKSFGTAVLAMARAAGHEIAQVFAPDGDRLADAAWAAHIPRRVNIEAATVAEGADLIVCAHAHCFVSERARDRARLGAIGYHPSLLPRHRGRDAVRWTVHMRDEVAGGTVFWLSNRVDGGDIAAQDWCHVLPGDDASSLWERELFPMGLRLLGRVLGDLERGVVVRRRQDDRAATWEPSWERAPVGRPDLPRLCGPDAEMRHFRASAELPSAQPSK